MSQVSTVHISLGILASPTPRPIKFYLQYLQALPTQNSKFFPHSFYILISKTQEPHRFGIGILFSFFQCISKRSYSRKGLFWLIGWGYNSLWWGWCRGLCISTAVTLHLQLGSRERECSASPSLIPSCSFWAPNRWDGTFHIQVGLSSAKTPWKYFHKHMQSCTS